jgi:hypothetical protein
MSQRKIFASSLLLLAATATTVYAALSFQKVDIYCTDGNLSPTAAVAQGITGQPIHGGLFVTFSEVGLGSNDGTNYLVTADATATYGCINNGSKHPKAANKETVSGPVSATATFTSDKNGKVSGSIAVPPLPAGSFDCPPGQTLVLSDVTNNVSVTYPGPYSLSFY